MKLWQNTTRNCPSIVKSFHYVHEVCDIDLESKTIEFGAKLSESYHLEFGEDVELTFPIEDLVSKESMELRLQVEKHKIEQSRLEAEALKKKETAQQMEEAERKEREEYERLKKKFG